MIKKLIVSALLTAWILMPAVRGQDGKVICRGLEVHYRIFGQGTPVLILGGGPGDVADRYLSLCEGLSKYCRCILADQRGTGRSTPAVLDASTVSFDLTLQDFEAIRTGLGLKKWTVLGFSYGGFLASAYAHFYPEAVSSLILLDSMGLNTDAFPHFIDNIQSKLQASDLEKLEYWRDPARMEADRHHAIVEQIRARMPGYFFDRKKALLVSQTMKDSDFNFTMGNLIWQDIEKKGLNLANCQPAAGLPVLILHGRQDPLGEGVPLALARHYPSAKLIFIEKCGHYAWLEQPETVYSAIPAFLANPATGNR